jgi:hypothetical protein
MKMKHKYESKACLKLHMHVIMKDAAHLKEHVNDNDEINDNNQET